MFNKITTASPSLNFSEVPMTASSFTFAEAYTVLLLHLARKHAEDTKQSSALLCLADAETLYARGELVQARQRALESLKYSVGVFHPDYLQATQA